MNDAYALAGVDVSKANETVSRYRELTRAWRHPDQIDAIGGFCGLFRMPGDSSRALAASTDGVGTKIMIATALQRYVGVGRDLVNLCVNDILVAGATPLFFLDYIASGKLEPNVAAEIVRGCYEACREHNCALLGGETAEMPGLYKPKDVDAAGTIVGVVDLNAMPKPETVQPGDAILGLPSRGLHTNGYTLARNLIGEGEWAAFGDALLAEHPSYYKEVRAIERVANIHAMAHITGGGLLENVPRTLPPTVKAIFEQTRWEVPELLQELCTRGKLSHEERYRTFNMGLGYTIVARLEDTPAAIAAAPGARVVGWIESRNAEEPQVVIHPARS